jgi:hypothetical protein
LTATNAANGTFVVPMIAGPAVRNPYMKRTTKIVAVG